MKYIMLLLLISCATTKEDFTQFVFSKDQRIVREKIGQPDNFVMTSDFYVDIYEVNGVDKYVYYSKKSGKLVAIEDDYERADYRAEQWIKATQQISESIQGVMNQQRENEKVRLENQIEFIPITFGGGNESD